MEIILYKTKDANNVINKVISDAISLQIVLKKDFNINSPELVLNGDYRGYNYVYFPDFKKYYFIKNYEQLNFKLVSIGLELDVLETYKDIILQSKCKYRRKIVNGDYGEINLDVTGKSILDVFESDIEVKKSNNVILTTLKD